MTAPSASPRPASVASAAPLALAAAVFLGAAAPAPAFAHHVVSDMGIAPVMPRTLAVVEVGAATFETQGHAGSWQALTAALEVSLGRRLSFFGFVPVGRVQIAGDEPQVGIGDVGLSGKVALYATEHGGLLLSAGAGVELPTGDQERGLGGGHLELTPFLLASSAVAASRSFDLVVHAMLSPRFALGGHHDAPAGGAAPHTHGSFLAPHGEREIFGRLMVALARGAAYVAGGGEGASVLVGEMGGYVAARGELGYLFAGAARVAAGFDGTVIGERRFGVRGRLALLWFF